MKISKKITTLMVILLFFIFTWLGISFFYIGFHNVDTFANAMIFFNMHNLNMDDYCDVSVFIFKTKCYDYRSVYILGLKQLILSMFLILLSGYSLGILIDLINDKEVNECLLLKQNKKIDLQVN